MTEEEAKQRWCPFARVSENGSAGPAHNRVQNRQGSDVMTPIASVCIGSACMAWRWEQDRLCENCEFTPVYPKPASGFCGLAGQP